jgi:tripartite-type tricarboxylate transporter receptor subunit TctC
MGAGAMFRKFLIAGVAAIFTTLATAPAAVAQDYPKKPIRLVVPFAPGGTTDIVARVVAGNITPHLGQTMVVENKAGGGGVIGATETARAAHDGYSLGVATVSTIATVPVVQPNTPYNPLTAFTPIINMAATPNVISVHPSVPAKDYKGFLEEIKNNPEKYAFASTGHGSITHLLMELYMSMTGTKMTHLAYKGAGPALNDVVGGQVPIILDNLPSSLPFIKTGRLVPIVVAAPERLKQLPNVPTFKEVGLEQANRMAWYGVYGPKGLPAEIVDKLHSAIKKTLEEPSVRARIEETASIIIANTPEEFAQQIKTEYEIYKKVVEERHIKPE